MWSVKPDEQDWDLLPFTPFYLDFWLSNNTTSDSVVLAYIAQFDPICYIELTHCTDITRQHCLLLTSTKGAKKSTFDLFMAHLTTTDTVTN